MLHILLAMKLCGSVDLISATSVPKLNFGNMMASVLDKWLTLLR